MKQKKKRNKQNKAKNWTMKLKKQTTSQAFFLSLTLQLKCGVRAVSKFLSFISLFAESGSISAPPKNKQKEEDKHSLKKKKHLVCHFCR